MCKQSQIPNNAEKDLLPMSDDTAAILVGNYKKFLRFVESRVGSKEVAEELLQTAFVNILERDFHTPNNDGAIKWFYRVLRNTLIDHYRKTDSEAKMKDKLGRADDPYLEMHEEIEEAICGCIKDLIPVIKSDYATLIKKIDLEGMSIAEFSHAEKMTTNNTMVKLHRARQALKLALKKSCGTCATHGCLDCGCKKK